MNTRRRVHLLLATSAALTGFPSLFAQGVATGTISGHVTDAASQLALAGVHVSVPGTALETFTDVRGDYVLANVPAGGTQEIRNGFYLL